VLARNWWAVALRGIVAILFGLGAFLWPGITLGVLILLYGAYAIVDGIFALIAAVRGAARHERWVWLLLEGIVDIAAGVIAFVWPGITALVLLYLIAAWALVTGISEIAAAIRLRQAISNEWLLALAGVASILFGIILFVAPGAGALAVVWIIGAYALVFGIILLALAARLFTWQRHRAPAGA